MTVFSILADALQSIPPKIRQALLTAYALAVVALAIMHICDVDTGNMAEVLVYIGGYLGVQSAANVKQTGTPETPVAVEIVDHQPSLFDEE